MNYYQMKEVKKEIYPAILLDTFISPKNRRRIRKTLFWILLALVIELVWPLLSIDVYILRSVTTLVACLYVTSVLLEAMYRNYYFLKVPIDIRVLYILDRAKNTEDLTVAFLKDELGQYVMYRLGFTKKEIQDFLKTKKDKVTKKEFEIIENDDDNVSFAEFGFSLIHFDSDLAKLCKSKGITVAAFKSALDWIAHLDYKIKDKQRWWTRENLLRIQSIGKNISFGQVYYLERLGHSMLSDTAYVQLDEKWRIYSDTVEKLEMILAKQVGGNVIVTARESYIARDAVASLTKKIIKGKVMPGMESKRLYVLETSHLRTHYETPNEFESMMNKIFTQAASAGNVIIVLPDLAEFVEHAYRIGVDVKNILYEALQSPQLHIIATTNERDFHQVLETDLDLMTVFEKLHIDESNEAQAKTVLLQNIIYEESAHKVFFTYQAVQRIVDHADRYFAELSLLDKSLDILNEIIVFAKKSDTYKITPEVVDVVVSAKTGIALGALTKAESEKIRSIQEQMSARIIGQDEAVIAICDAMMRSRLELQDAKKPLGSFLFVGPTGVGKTQTAKVLADLFFGYEEYMLRSDMSEYSDDNAITKMIGHSGEVGLFASKIREKGSGVLLLDEFEKASSQVHDLFLQIIDEGFFTDGRGERVMMRNFIIIATSNAGSDLWAAEHKIDKQTFLDVIISKNILRAELLNRFDDIILFNSLSSKEIEKIVHIALKQLIERLETKGITLTETSELVAYLVKSGLNPLFGAREIHKVIKKQLESKIAHAMVLGDLFEGDTISFTIINNVPEIQKYT